MRTSIKSALESGMPCSAECGGLMYLSKKLYVDGESYDMVGALDIDIAMEQQRQAHGYSHIVVQDDHPWLTSGSDFMCHEHHHSKAVRIGEDIRFAYKNTRGQGIINNKDGAIYKNTVAGYAHVNAIADPIWAPSFVSAAKRYKDRS